MAKNAPATSNDPLAIEREALVRAMTDINLDQLLADEQDKRQKVADLARAHDKGRSLSLEAKRDHPEAYRLAVEERRQADNELSAASDRRKRGERTKQEMQRKIAEIDRQMSGKQRAADAKTECERIANQIFALHGDRIKQSDSLPERRQQLAKLIDRRKAELQSAIAKAGTSQADGIGGKLPLIDADIEVARGGLAATEDKIGAIAGEITELKSQYEIAERAYHIAMYDVAAFEDDAHYRADLPRRTEFELRCFLAKRNVPDRRPLDKDAVSSRLREVDGELPTLPRELFRAPVAGSAADDANADTGATQAAA
jgi:hypothetical protein